MTGTIRPTDEDAAREDLLQKAINLFTFLGNTQRLLIKPVLTADKYEKVIWFADLPDHPAIRSTHQAGPVESDDKLLSIDRIPRAEPPIPPQELLPWLVGDIRISAQTTTIKGRVTDASNNPLPGANVFLRDTYDGATADTSGNFQFETEENGEQTLQVTYLGFDSVAQKVTLKGGVFVFNTALKEAFNELKVVVISAGAFEASDEKKVTVLKPHETGCYQTDTALPVQLLDSGSATIGQDMYVVGGKTSAAHVNSLYRFNVTTDAWTRLTDKPGTAVENPSVVAWNGKLYVAGGASGPFSGAVTETWVYDPVADSWAAGPPLATARAGAGAALVGSTMYVVGGMDNSGASLTSVEKLDLASLSAWTSAPSLGTPRDNPGVVAIGTHSHHEVAADDPHRHRPRDHERETPEHLLLGHVGPGRECGPNPLGKPLVVRHALPPW